MKNGGDGGDCPQFHTEHFINKMTKINQKNRMHGKKHTKEARQKQRERAKGRWTLDWFIERYGENDGTERWNKRNINLSDKRKGELNPFYGKTWEYEKHPRYTDISKDELLKLIKEGNGGVLLAKHFNTTTTTIYKKIKHYWNCKITELK